MDSQGSFSAANNPGEELLQQAKRLADLPEFQRAGVTTVHFDWDRDRIVFFCEEYAVPEELPLRSTIEQYKEKLK